MSLSIIVAISENRVIGRDGDLPWHISEDLRRFKSLTMGCPIIMGRKTYESIGRPLPGRTSVVISTNADYPEKGILLARDFCEALDLVRDASEVFVVGGARIYELALPFVDRIYLTQVYTKIDGDTFFPEIDWSHWDLVEQSPGKRCADDKFEYSFQTFDRREKE